MIQFTRAASLLTLFLLQSASRPAVSWSSSSSSPASCPFSNTEDHVHDHGHIAHVAEHDHQDHDHEHGHSTAHEHECGGHSHDGHHHHHHHHHTSPADGAHLHEHKLAEELAEEEELKLYGFKSDIDAHEGHETGGRRKSISSLGLWVRALGCSLLVSMASLICLIILPLIVSQGKPSRIVVDFLAAFGAGAMLGDAFLHQLPHALGGSHGHSHSVEHEHGHSHSHSHGHHEHDHTASHGHAHSIQDLSVGLTVLAGILLFFVVEKIVRQVEAASSKGKLPWAHHHHHHNHHRHAVESSKQLLTEDEMRNRERSSKVDAVTQDTSMTNDDSLQPEKNEKPYRRKTADAHEESEVTQLVPAENIMDEKSNLEVESSGSPNLILGYLNLFSDGVHNFTDGMALGAAFLNHGVLGGWSRTLFLLAHELPQEVGDFGILVQSGFSVPKALAFNFLSALVALAGTAVALVVGGNPGHSSLIEGFTAGGFIYIAVAGVLPEMHQYGTSMKTTMIQLLSLSLGMSVALIISLIE
ncbi:hypothetical protein KP509_14G015000 [Ceratopteris richardii]|uniref:IAA-alanine resistance protein 1 n=1 Tax=Ceratopteris richardii TaxID=49495 RepID=A0A8T2T7Q6_CERRI|nr:hypothetical protein KP509_14G015000 [Ceratopteris richardii]